MLKDYRLVNDSLDSLILDTVFVYIWLYILAIYLLKFPLAVLFEYSSTR